MNLIRNLLGCPLFESYTSHIVDVLDSENFKCFAAGRKAAETTQGAVLLCPSECLPLLATDYRALKEVAYINDETNLETQAWKAFLVCCITGLIMVEARTMMIALRLRDVNIGRGLTRFALEFLISMVPMVLSMLDVGGFEVWCLILTAVICINLLYIRRFLRRKQALPDSEIELENMAHSGELFAWRVLSDVDESPIKNGNFWEFISVYRAYLMSQTCIAVFAVDFFLFPRDQGKSESFGMSVMDLGVGIVILSSGIVSRACRTTDPVPVLRALFSHWPVILIGLLRFVSTWGTDYYVSMTEYGVHWNFFLTIAVSGIGSAILVNRVVSARHAWILALLMIVVYQIYLTVFGGEEYILFAERTNYFSKNREGILGSIGFLAMSMMGISLGNHLLFDPRFPTIRHKFTLVLVPTIACFVAAFILYVFLGVAPSRRMSNLPFVLCVAAFNLSGVLLLFADDLLQIYVGTEAGWRIDDRSPADAVDPDIDLLIWKGMHGSQLVIFLVANVICGLVNLSTQTLTYNGVGAICWIMLYTASWSMICFVFGKRNMSLKFW